MADLIGAAKDVYDAFSGAYGIVSNVRQHEYETATAVAGEGAGAAAFTFVKEVATSLWNGTPLEAADITEILAVSARAGIVAVYSPVALAGLAGGAGLVYIDTHLDDLLNWWYDPIQRYQETVMPTAPSDDWAKPYMQGKLRPDCRP